MSARISLAPPGVSTHRRAGGLDHLAQDVSAYLALAEIGVTVGAGPGRITRVIGVQ